MCHKCGKFCKCASVEFQGCFFFLGRTGKDERPFAASTLKQKLDEGRERCQLSIVSVLHQMQHLVIYPLA